jgi:hypothetical protein
MHEARTLPTLDLRANGVRELIELTNLQFGFWEDMLRMGTKDEIPSGSLMNYWFIMSQLAGRGPSYRIEKQQIFSSIPNLSVETTRKYVASAASLGFVETVRSRGVSYLQLTTTGQLAVGRTLARWLDEFGGIQNKYFRELSRVLVDS